MYDGKVVGSTSEHHRNERLAVMQNYVYVNNTSPQFMFNA
jgi:hypothetical protein